MLVLVLAFVIRIHHAIGIRMCLSRSFRRSFIRSFRLTISFAIILSRLMCRCSRVCSRMRIRMCISLSELLIRFVLSVTTRACSESYTWIVIKHSHS